MKHYPIEVTFESILYSTFPLALFLFFHLATTCKMTFRYSWFSSIHLLYFSHAHTQRVRERETRNLSFFLSIFWFCSEHKTRISENPTIFASTLWWWNSFIYFRLISKIRAKEKETETERNVCVCVIKSIRFDEHSHPQKNENVWWKLIGFLFLIFVSCFSTSLFLSLSLLLSLVFTYMWTLAFVCTYRHSQVEKCTYTRTHAHTRIHSRTFSSSLLNTNTLWLTLSFHWYNNRHMRIEM